ncbi:MAG: winged helix-turn-helix transcriptional regulator [Streptosporangiaceae bacterium]|nr:winged helix-turn-helix transcriptional regulator [Streptosporangiaceae bacterium]MBV9853772.1 winged helix-turn-helix transcriptional regulator [Streptosporangiaceae bacterium]
MGVWYRFGRDDLLRTRFAIAPLMDLIGAFYVLRDPGRSVVHRPWREWAIPRTAGLDLSLLDIAAPLGGGGFWPVFVGPPPKVPHAKIGSELDRIRATPPQQVKDEIMRTYPRGPTAARPFAEDPAGALTELVGQMRAFWEAALAPWWARMSAVLESEIASRARRLAAAGPQAAFTGLHQTVRWDHDTLVVHPTTKAPADVDLAGRGLLLIPAIFTWPKAWPRTDPPWDPALVYPAAGIADVWAADERGDDALEALIGQRRAQILRELDRPASTLQLARRMQVSAGGVSDHLKVLRQAGLVTGCREGRQVIYTRTAKGDTLRSG